jgi:two-component system, OmpR family, phosphate regulon sensor histidine kinase PhoR
VWPYLIIVALAAVTLWLALRLRQARQAQLNLRTQVDALAGRQRAAEQDAQAQQAAVFNSMVEGLVLLDPDGRIQLANRQFSRLFGTAEDLKGKTLIEATRMHDLAELVGGLSADQPAQGRELRLPGLQERWLEVNAAAVFDEARGRRGTVVVFHDQTRIKKLERNREEFVANVSHELRTPLSLIKGYTETLLDGAKDNPDVSVKFLQTIDRNAERLKLLIEDLLTISELESGRIRLQLQTVALTPLVAKLLEDFKPRAAARGVRLNCEVPELTAKADPDRVQQVLSNLVDNAIKYGRSDGVVTIRGHDAGEGRIELCVADDGPGIPEDARERIFERFYRLDKARSREQGGTGLGLSIVKHIIQSHGGKVWVESEPGKGSRFFFSLPKV